MMQIDFELCTGCGNCAAVCPSQAITLEAGKACIDVLTCMLCEACLEACPTGAVSVVESLPVPVALEPELVVHAGEPAGASGLARFAPAVGATLTYLGREFVPRLADVLFNLVEDRLTQPAVPTCPERASAGRGWRQGGGDRGWHQASEYDSGFRGGGRGWRRRFYATGLPRWARPEENGTAPEGEATWLRGRANWLKDQLEVINRRIEAIEKGSAE